MGKHTGAEQVESDPDLFFCTVCEHWLGDAAGSINYGFDRPMLPKSVS